MSVSENVRSGLSKNKSLWEIGEKMMNCVSKNVMSEWVWLRMWWEEWVWVRKWWVWKKVMIGMSVNEKVQKGMGVTDWVTRSVSVSVMNGSADRQMAIGMIVKEQVKKYWMSKEGLVECVWWCVSERMGVTNGRILKGESVTKEMNITQGVGRQRKNW